MLKKIESPLKLPHYQLWTNFVRKRWPWYLAGALSVLLTNICQVFFTRAMGWLLDLFTKNTFPISYDGSKHDKFMALFFVLLASRLILTLGRMLWRLTLARQTHHAAGFLKEKVWKSARYFPRHELKTIYTKGKLMNAANSDVSVSRFLFGFTLVGMMDVIFLGIITIATMLAISWKFTILCLLVMSFLPWSVKKLSTLQVNRYTKAQESLDDFNELVSQSVGSIRLQKLSELGRFWTEFLVQGASHYRKTWILAVKTNLLYMPLIGLSTILVYVVLFSYGVYQVFEGQMSVGDFVAINGLAFILQDPLIELGYIIAEWRKGMASLERLNNIYDAPKESFLYKEAHHVEKHNVVFDIVDLSFTFPDGKDEVLSRLNFKVHAKERMGIKGPIGSGKSILLDILSGLERNYTGEVFFKGKEFHHYSHQSLRDVIAHVHQRPFLFADTIRANVSLDRDMSDEEIWSYLKIAGLDEDVKRFDKGLLTPLGEWGVNLSGGQKQRLSLARALARKPRILLLDDCLSAVDTVTEEKILKRIDEFLSETTVIWVAHRDSTLKYCDHILELKSYE